MPHLEGLPWHLVPRDRIREISADENENLSCLPKTWTAAQISSFVCGRPDWPFLASMFMCIWKEYADAHPDARDILKRICVPPPGAWTPGKTELHMSARQFVEEFGIPPHPSILVSEHDRRTAKRARPDQESGPRGGKQQRKQQQQQTGQHSDSSSSSQNSSRQKQQQTGCPSQSQWKSLSPTPIITNQRTCTWCPATTINSACFDAAVAATAAAAARRQRTHSYGIQHHDNVIQMRISTYSVKHTYSLVYKLYTALYTAVRTRRHTALSTAILYTAIEAASRLHTAMHTAL